MQERSSRFYFFSPSPPSSVWQFYLIRGRILCNTASVAGLRTNNSTDSSNSRFSNEKVANSLAASQKVVTFAAKNLLYVQMTKEEAIIRKLRERAQKALPKDAHVWLYGSRARGDAHKDSDWDILILLPKSSITTQDENDVAYPLVVEGWKNNVAVSPQVFTFDEWERRSFTPYYKNVEKDKLLIK